MQDNIKNEFESVNNGDALIEVAEQVDQYSTFSSIGIEDGVATNEVHLIVAGARVAHFLSTFVPDERAAS